MQKLLFLFVAFFTLSASALDLQKLNLINPEEPDAEGVKKSIQVEIKLEDEDILHAHFDVVSPVNYTKNEFSEDGGPYEADVVEIFVAPELENGEVRTYYEFEVSPLDQTLVVKITVDDNGRKHFTNNYKTSFTHSVTQNEDPKGWSADLYIPLKELGWKGDVSTVIGNNFSILGKRQLLNSGRRLNRHYWSSFLPQQEKPNFHKTEYFKRLL
ncbi:MAG: carbohydrate-binding family 9-like protein [Bdellovibrionota bacterium]